MNLDMSLRGKICFWLQASSFITLFWGGQPDAACLNRSDVKKDSFSIFQTPRIQCDINIFSSHILSEKPRLELPVVMLREQVSSTS